MFHRFRYDQWAHAGDRERARMAEAVHVAFTRTRGLYVTDFASLGTTMPALHAHLGTVREALERQPVTRGFQGFDDKESYRQTLGAIHRYGTRHVDLAETEALLATTDGDPDTYRQSLAVLRKSPRLVAALDATTRVASHVLEAVMQIVQRSFGVKGEEWNDVLRGSTSRHRAILYDARVQKSSCGVHPDGNMLSVLFTDTPGLRTFDAHGRVHEPDPNGVVVLPGSLLWRWTRGVYQPVFHYVRDVADRSKTSVVYFYNLERGRSFAFLRAGDAACGRYENDIQRHKIEDIDAASPFAATFEKLRATLDYGPRAARLSA
jgi:2OG-Fe(II) oxygenase superfamily